MTQPTETKTGENRALWPLVALLLVSLAPLLLAWWFSHNPEHGAKSRSHGVLIAPPRAVPDQDLLAVAAGETGKTALPPRTLHGRWSLVYPLPTDCEQACHRALYLMHQVEQALGKDSLRVQRIIHHGAHTGIPALPGQWRLARPEALLSRLRDLHTEGHIYLVDPRGQLMMYYQQDFEPKGLKGDLRRLLRASRIG